MYSSVLDDEGTELEVHRAPATRLRVKEDASADRVARDEGGDEDGHDGLIRGPRATLFQNFLEMLEEFMANAGLNREAQYNYDENGNPVLTGVAPNELTSLSLRDKFAGTPWHKSVPVRIEAG